MGRSQTTFSKREKEKKRQKKKEEKEKRKAERKANATSNSLDEMMAYVDANGNIVDTPPPAEQKKEEINAEDIVVGVPKKEKEEEPEFREGKVAFFNDSKGYGFINEKDTGEKYFVHINSCVDNIEENDSVRFDLEKGPRGMNAVNVSRA